MDGLTDPAGSRGLPSDASDGSAAPAELAALQTATVRAALQGAPLPGGAAGIALPDRAFLPAGALAPLAADHLAAGVHAALADVVRPVDDADRAVLRFAPPRRERDALWLTLEVVLQDGGAGPQPLGGVQVGFARTAGGWQAIEAPRAFAT